MLRSIAIFLLFSTPATAEVLDLSKPQTEGFRSVIDARGIASLKPQDGNPRPEPEAIALQAAIPIRLSSTPSPSEAAEKDVPRAQTMNVGAYIKKDSTQVGSHKRAPRSSFRMGRRR